MSWIFPAIWSDPGMLMTVFYSPTYFILVFTCMIDWLQYLFTVKKRKGNVESKCSVTTWLCLSYVSLSPNSISVRHSLLYFKFWTSLIALRRKWRDLEVTGLGSRMATRFRQVPAGDSTFRTDGNDVTCSICNLLLSENKLTRHMHWKLF